MAKKETWQKKWVVIEDEVGNKTVSKAILYEDIRGVETEVKFDVNQQQQRVYTLTLESGTIYEITETAVIVNQPKEFQELLNGIALTLKA